MAHYINVIFLWCLANPSKGLAIGSALFALAQAFWRLVSPSLYKRWPRLRPVVQGVFAIIPFSDLWRFGLKVYEAWTGRELDPHPDASVTRLQAENAALRAQLLAAQPAAPPRPQDPG